MNHLLFLDVVKPGEVLLLLFIFIAVPIILIVRAVNKNKRYKDVIHLKNGSIIAGKIIEQSPNVSVKIETKDKNLLVFKNEEIDKIIPKK